MWRIPDGYKRLIDRGVSYIYRKLLLAALEKGQAYGTKAKQAISELVFGKEVTLQTRGKDKNGRTVADVLLPDGTNVNHQLVKEGWCWWYQKHAPKDFALQQSEQEEISVYRHRGRGSMVST